MRKFIIVLLLGLTLWPAAGWAIGDQRCWKEDDCKAAREKIIGTDSSAKEGFISAEEDSTVAAACPNKIIGSKVGFCLPAGQTVTNISFGGTNKFLNIGEFIKFIYRYSMWAATIIAVMLVIVSGIQWTASGGNADMIGSAKKRIAGAISGLILLAFAYTILNTINPFLVNLRLPQVWLINEQGLAPPFCTQLKNNEMLSYYKKSDEIINDQAAQEKYNQSKWTIPSNVEKQPAELYFNRLPACGHDYFVQGSGGLSCQGALCGKGNTCLPAIYDEKNKDGVRDIIYKSECRKGSLVIHLKLDDLKQKIGALINNTIFDTFILDLVNHPQWLDHGQGPGINMNLYYGCDGVTGLFPINNGHWDTGNWLLTWNEIPPLEKNSLSGEDFSQYVFYFNAGNHLWGKKEGQMDSNDKVICPNGGTPYGVWVRLEVDDAALANANDANLFIGETAAGKALLGSWKDVKDNPIGLEKIEKTGVFLDGTVSGDVLESIWKDKSLDPGDYPGGIYAGPPFFGNPD